MWDIVLSKDGIGSEGGTVLKDEEYMNSCRITLEKCPKYYAITCGVYGAMVHTVFCSIDDCMDIYERMKVELQNFIDKDTTESEEIEFYTRFTSQF